METIIESSGFQNFLDEFKENDFNLDLDSQISFGIELDNPYQAMLGTKRKFSSYDVESFGNWPEDFHLEPPSDSEYCVNLDLPFSTDSVQFPVEEQGIQTPSPQVNFSPITNSGEHVNKKRKLDSSVEEFEIFNDARSRSPPEFEIESPLSNILLPNESHQSQTFNPAQPSTALSELRKTIKGLDSELSTSLKESFSRLANSKNRNTPLVQNPSLVDQINFSKDFLTLQLLCGNISTVPTSYYVNSYNMGMYQPSGVSQPSPGVAPDTPQVASHGTYEIPVFNHQPFVSQLNSNLFYTSSFSGSSPNYYSTVVPNPALYS